MATASPTSEADHSVTAVVSQVVPTAADMYREHYDAVLRYVRARVATREVAEDLAGDVFCKAVAGLGSYKPMRGSALPWLYTIAAHRVADHYRALRPSTGLDEVLSIADGAPNPCDVVAAQDLVDKVWEFSQRLPASQRRALWLRYVEELDHKEIALQMGRSVEAVKLLVHRAIRSLRQAMLELDSAGLESLTASPGRHEGARLGWGRTSGEVAAA